MPRARGRARSLEPVATAVRLGRLGFVTVDEFGRYAAGHAQACRPEGDVAILDAVPADGGFRLLALLAGRPVPGVADSLDAFAFRSGSAFLTIWPNDGRLQVGPVVVPGAGPCYRCFTARERQHAPGRDAMDAIHEHQASTLPPASLGLLPPLARLAASEVLRLDATPGGLAVRAGHVWVFSVPPTTAVHGTVIAVDGCSRCGPANIERTG